MKNNINNRNLLNFLRHFLIGALIALTIIILPAIISLAFDYVKGEEITKHALNEAIRNTTKSDDIALSIMAWEPNYFYNPYSLYDKNITLQKYGIFKINGDYNLFIRGAPVSWIIYSKLANCEEYSKVFVALMKEAGIKANLIHAPGADHVWAEYMHDDYRIAVDPSQNIIIGSHKKDFEKNMNVKFSYIEAIDSQNNIIDVSDEYIERGNLTIFVLNTEKPVPNAQVKIKSPYLMKNRGGRYDSPINVLSRNTDTNGKVFLKLGYQEYIVQVRVNTVYLLDSMYQKNVTVEIGKENSIIFNLESDERSRELFITRT